MKKIQYQSASTSQYTYYIMEIKRTSLLNKALYIVADNEIITILEAFTANKQHELILINHIMY